MILASLTVLVLTAQLTNGQTTFPNLESGLGRGYDLLYGNPRSTEGTALDPGFRQSIWNLTGHSRATIDGYDIPEGANVYHCLSCLAQFSSTSMAGTTSYQNSLSVSASASGKGWGQSFSTSSDFQKVAQGMETSNRIYMQTETTCTQYCAEIQSYASPVLTDGFQNALHTLVDTNNDGAYELFIQTFGTHAVTFVEMGARVAGRTEIQSHSYQKLMSSGLNVEAAATFKVWGVTGSFGALTEQEKEQVEEFESFTENTLDTSVGVLPNSRDPNAWVEKIREKPLPVRIRLTPMDDMLQLESMPSNIVAKMSSMLDGYCSRLQLQGVNCRSPNADPALPQPAQIRMVWMPAFGQYCCVPQISDGPPSWQTTLAGPYRVRIWYTEGSGLQRIQLDVHDGFGNIASTQVMGNYDVDARDTLLDAEYEPPGPITQMEICYDGDWQDRGQAARPITYLIFMSNGVRTRIGAPDRTNPTCVIATVSFAQDLTDQRLFGFRVVHAGNGIRYLQARALQNFF